MKNVAIACVVLMLFAATASAGELAVADSTLSNMGLGSMQPMSDTDGLAVRGMGVYSTVWGGSSAGWFSGNAQSYSENFYEAGSEWHGPVGSSSSGASLSFAGEVLIEFWADPTGFTLGVQAGAAISGGFATATSM